MRECPDQTFHRAPSTFAAKVDVEPWLAAERRLMQTTSGRRASRGGRRSCGQPKYSGRMPRRGSSSVNSSPALRRSIAGCWSGSSSRPSPRCRCLFGTSRRRWWEPGTAGWMRAGRPSGLTPTRFWGRSSARPWMTRSSGPIHAGSQGRPRLAPVDGGRGRHPAV